MFEVGVLGDLMDAKNTGVGASVWLWIGARALTGLVIV
jgi:hypothetical protein